MKGRHIIYDFFNNPIGIENCNHKIELCSKKEADATICKYHYSHKSPKNTAMSFSVDDGLGYIQLGYGIRPAKKGFLGEYVEKGNYFEFDRMWLSDKLPKLSESQVIGLLLEFLRKTKPEIKFIITYADGSVGNRGIIYKATNAIELESVACDFYLLLSGERVHPVSMWHRHKTRAWKFLQEQYPGIKHIKKEFRQYRFVYILDKK